ncbi:hypothetical protein QBZ16_001819 [Prototheca wickerhamii]|uniref:BHLH domain-containing protein n=1 Tax=Prototheca wickerhamii TaxID=3111 RepID=A0AAD9IFJ0_PROWI|nr:hypothetical protein QBZ16_001819 [Prototheca wickerhamii]
MDYPWEKRKDTDDASSSLAPGETANIMLDLDDKTLQRLDEARHLGFAQCLVAVEGPGLAIHEEEAEARANSAGPSSGSRDKRKRHDDNLAFSSWLSDKFGDDDGDEGDDSDQGDDSQRRIGRKGKPMTNAAVAKASREKARRERLNECFEELARLCDPTGRGIKTDRVSVVADAIRVLTQLRVENNQLRQLNKFLEERVAGYERARAQSLFQQSMLQQQQQQQGVALAPQASLPVGAGAQLPMPHGSGGTSPFLRSESSHSLPAGHGVGPTPPPAMPGYEAFQGTLGAVPLKGEQLGALTGVELTARLEENVTVAEAGDCGSGAGRLAWLPAPNATEDGKLRPPAA